METLKVHVICSYDTCNVIEIFTYATTNTWKKSFEDLKKDLSTTPIHNFQEPCKLVIDGVTSQHVVIALEMRVIPHVGIRLNTLLIRYIQIEQMECYNFTMHTEIMLIEIET